MFDVFCIDFNNYVNVPDHYQVNVSDYTDIENTRYGETAIDEFQYMPNAFSVLDRYTMAAWLTTQYNYSAGGSNPSNVGIQTAIWQILALTNSHAPQAGDDDYWLQSAADLKTSNPDLFASAQQHMRIYSDVRIPTANSRYSGTKQEMIATVPEPATYALIGLGLAGLALVRRRRG